MGLDGSNTSAVNSTSGIQRGYALQQYTSTEQTPQRNFNRGSNNDVDVDEVVTSCDVEHTSDVEVSVLVSIYLSKTAVDDLLLKYPYLNESLCDWSDDPKENWDRLVMEVEKSQLIAADIASTANGVRNLRVDEPSDEDNRGVRARSGYAEGSRNDEVIDVTESSEMYREVFLKPY
eukprot:gene36293-biopygen859